MNPIESLKLETLNIKEDDIVVYYFDVDKYTIDRISAMYRYLESKLDNKVILLPELTKLESYNKEAVKKILIKALESIS